MVHRADPSPAKVPRGPNEHSTPPIVPLETRFVNFAPRKTTRKMSQFESSYKRLLSSILSLSPLVTSIESDISQIFEASNSDEIQKISARVARILVDAQIIRDDYSDLFSSIAQSIDSMDDSDINKDAEQKKLMEFKSSTEAASSMEVDPVSLSNVVSKLENKFRRSLETATVRASALSRLTPPISVPSNGVSQSLPLPSTPVDGDSTSTSQPSTAHIEYQTLAAKIVDLEARLSNSNAQSSPHSNIVLPPITLQTFDGVDITKWPAYKYQLDMLILNQPQYNERRRSATLLESLELIEETLRTELEDVTMINAISDRNHHQKSVVVNNYSGSLSMPRSSVTNSSPPSPKAPRGPKCVFCGNHNYSFECTTVKLAKDRKEILRRKKLCFCCFSSEHNSADCSKKCAKCSGERHRSICDKPSNTAVNVVSMQQPERLFTTTATVADPPSNRSISVNTQTSYTHPSEQLFTVDTQIANPDLAVDNSVTASILLDHGAQANLITRDLADRLTLVPFDQRELTISGFNDDRVQSSTYDIVKLDVVTDHDHFPIEAVVVDKSPLSSIHNQPLDIADLDVINTSLVHVPHHLTKHTVTHSELLLSVGDTLEILENSGVTKLPSGFHLIKSSLGPFVVGKTRKRIKRIDPLVSALTSNPHETRPNAPTGTISITFPFCTVRNPDGSQGEVYVIRAITEDGSRITLENDRDARISFDSSINIRGWVFTHDYGATVNLIALACAEVVPPVRVLLLLVPLTQLVSRPYSLNSKEHAPLPYFESSVPQSLASSKKVGEDTRSDPGAEMGVDKCIGEAPTGTISITFPFCTVRNPDGSQGEVYVIRAITEDGSRITLENDRDARISFDSSINIRVGVHSRLWCHCESYRLGVCRSRSSCPCPSLTCPTDTTCLSSVLTEQQGTCTAPILRYTQGGAVTSRPMNGQLARVMCKAGRWIVGNWGGNYITKTLASACCAAS
ncbi:hypothetical protein PRIPAC_87724 [Pristionchus pacificus]|uniref:Uncharacterized protein n=1 Tax=Pristionchus pacificus TaxID=54126 RepID=A0A2A6B6P1_PRIPA|nr:hypothetical protein PRIPAC_87724 [Pristionchus pacificus]|eukprot:PDM61531.1 hypothetical protein PRIPAC_50973 [Pristionchus pacificus]